MDFSFVSAKSLKSKPFFKGVQYQIKVYFEDTAHAEVMLVSFMKPTLSVRQSHEKK